MVVNGGTVGGGGAGDFHEDQPFGLAVVTYERAPGFRPLAADMVTINPRDGSAARSARCWTGTERDQRGATGVSGGRPSSTAITLSAASRAMPSRAGAVAEPMCGASTTRSSAHQLGGTSGSCS